jgi:hypothetical protein
MTKDNDQGRIEHLDVLVGRWTMTASFNSDGPPPLAETTFEWLEGRTFLVQRWRVDHPDAPDGIAVIGYDAEKATLLQHYFDSRGVVRVYDMSLVGNTWQLIRIGKDFSQRYIGTFDESRDVITGSWEASSDGGATWERDFDLTYTRASDG